MDIHKPKPWHGLREFLKEYAIIVVGVLTALGAEQVAESMGWRHKIQEAEHAMRLELAEDDGPQAIARLAAVACFDEQLDGLEAMATVRADRRSFRRAALSYGPANRTWDSQAWQAVVASDVGTHMGADDLVRWSSPYRIVPELAGSGTEELHARTALGAVRDAGGPLTEAEADRATGVIATLRAENLELAYGGMVLLEAMKQAGIEVAKTDRADIFKQARDSFGACARDPTTLLASRGSLTTEDRRQFDSVDAARERLGLKPVK
jgi:hypothetical protein